MVAKEEGPLAVFGYGGELFDDVADGPCDASGYGNEEAGHEGEVEAHMELIVIAEVMGDIGGPLIGLGQEEGSGESFINELAQAFAEGMGFGEIFAVGAIPFVEIGHRVDTEAVETHGQPVGHDLKHFFLHGGIVVVEIGLVAVKSMPVVGSGTVVPCPVGGVAVGKNDSGIVVSGRVIGPDIVVAVGGFRVGDGSLKPRMVFAGVVDDEISDDADAEGMGCGEEFLELGEISEVGVNPFVIGNIVTAIKKG